MEEAEGGAYETERCLLAAAGVSGRRAAGVTQAAVPDGQMAAAARDARIRCQTACTLHTAPLEAHYPCCLQTQREDRACLPDCKRPSLRLR